MHSVPPAGTCRQRSAGRCMKLRCSTFSFPSTSSSTRHVFPMAATWYKLSDVPSRVGLHCSVRVAGSAAAAVPDAAASSTALSVVAPTANSSATAAAAVPSASENPVNSGWSDAGQPLWHAPGACRRGARQQRQRPRWAPGRPHHKGCRMNARQHCVHFHPTHLRQPLCCSRRCGASAGWEFRRRCCERQPPAHATKDDDSARVGRDGGDWHVGSAGMRFCGCRGRLAMQDLALKLQMTSCTALHAAVTAPAQC